jgi:hypothetical protein
LEVWGAQGGDGRQWNDKMIIENTGGRGGYSKGNKSLSSGTKIYLCVGGKGGEPPYGQGSYGLGGYNGGGNGGTETFDSNGPENGAGGGGATHVASQTGTLNSLVNAKSSVYIVAGGGGGGTGCFSNKQAYDSYGVTETEQYGGAGGGLTGVTNSSFSIPGGQTGSNTYFGKGQSGYSASQNSNLGGTGGNGGGYYGGTRGTTWNSDMCTAGAGGSGYIGGVSNGTTIAGNQTMPSPTGGTETGHSGNGYCKITWHPSL